MNEDSRKKATTLLSGWINEIRQQNKSIRRKNKLIARLRREADELSKQNLELKIAVNAVPGMPELDRAKVVLTNVCEERDELRDRLKTSNAQIDNQRATIVETRAAFDKQKALNGEINNTLLEANRVASRITQQNKELRKKAQQAIDAFASIAI